MSIYPQLAPWQQPIQREIVDWHANRASWLTLLRDVLPQEYRARVQGKALPESPMHYEPVSTLLDELNRHFPVENELESWSSHLPVISMCEPPWDVESESLGPAELLACAMLGHELADTSALDALVGQGYSLELAALPDLRTLSWPGIAQCFRRRGHQYARFWRVIQWWDGSTGNPLRDDSCGDPHWLRAINAARVSLTGVRAFTRYGEDLNKRETEIGKVNDWIQRDDHFAQVVAFWNRCVAEHAQ